MADRVLKRVTTVNHPQRAEHLTLNPGDEIPDWCREIFDANPEAYYVDADAEASSPDYTNDYSEMKVADLSDLVKDRGLEPKSGKKDDLIAALEAADAGDSGANDE